MVMATIAEMATSAVDMFGGGMEAVEGLFSAGDTAAEAGQVAAGAAKAANPEVSAALSEVGMIDMPTGGGGMVSAAQSASKAAMHTPGLPDWAVKAIEPVMASLTQAALRPQHNPIAPAGGHGVSASGAGAMKPFQEIEKMAGDNPLDGLNQWSHLF